MAQTELSRRFQRRMIALGLTQAEVAKRAGVSQPSVHKILSGKTTTLNRPVEYAQALGCTTEWLVTGKGLELPGLLGDVSASKYTDQHALNLDEQRHLDGGQAFLSEAFADAPGPLKEAILGLLTLSQQDPREALRLARVIQAYLYK